MYNKRISNQFVKISNLKCLLSYKLKLKFKKKKTIKYLFINK